VAYPLYDISALPLLADPKGKYQLLDSAVQPSYQIQAEMLLGLDSPAETGDEAEQITYAIGLQILFLLEQGVTPEVLKSANQSSPGVATTYRDRWLDPRAAGIVRRVLEVEQVRFEPPAFGV
jgi:hypothetical protein